jgi:serine/threonine protein phosphatase PrpC
MCRKSGGNLILGRVGGVLAVTRSFGDFHLKYLGLIIGRKLGLSAVPEVKRVELRLHHKYLVVASDGLWDFITIPVLQIPYLVNQLKAKISH